MTPIAVLQRRAEADAAMELREESSHWAGPALGLASLGLGVWAADRAAMLLAWVALGGVVVSMGLSRWWVERGPGWRIDFAARRVAPVAQRGDEVVVEGAGWQVRTGPGDKYASMAVDLLHDDRGRVARLLERHALRRRDRRGICALADVLAQRLQAGRTGIRY